MTRSPIPATRLGRRRELVDRYGLLAGSAAAALPASVCLGLGAVVDIAFFFLGECGSGASGAEEPVPFVLGTNGTVLSTKTR
jgi:hypothetical protein